MPYDAPLAIHRETVKPEWIDYNGHMNVAYYVLAFDHAIDRVLELLELGPDYRERTGCTTYVVEAHVHYLQEVKQGDPLDFTFQLLDYDRKRFHYFVEMHAKEHTYLAATSEQLTLHVDQRGPRAAEMPQATLDRLSAIYEAHRTLPRPPQAGHVIGIRRKSATSEGGN